MRYTWEHPNPTFLDALAGPRPLFIYAPQHYLKQFHGDYVDAAEMEKMVDDAGARNWAGLHHRKHHPYKYDNPELPVLQPWIDTTYMPAERFVFKRNPFFHRIDPNGLQLPYIDEVIIHIASAGLIAAKTGAGESDLQGRHLTLEDYTFLKEGEARGSYQVRLWQNGYGSQYALYPNMNSNDPVWRELTRDRRFRRALSMGINRSEINQVIYFGLAQEAGNSVLPGCPLYREEYASAWVPVRSGRRQQALLDELGLTSGTSRGLRLMRNGRTAGNRPCILREKAPRNPTSPS